MRIKKLLLTAAVILCLFGYSFAMKHGDSNTVLKPLAPNNANTGTSTTNTGSTMAASQSYKDGSYTGDVADAFYGNIQVQVTVSGGKITDVQFLQYPNDRQNSIYINQQAMPILRQEALQAQSAHVDGVSGATDTSQAFVESLSSALSKAA